MIFKDPSLSVADLVALAHERGKPYDVVLDNYIKEPARKLQFIVENALHMDADQILHAIKKLPPAYGRTALFELVPFFQTQAENDAGCLVYREIEAEIARTPLTHRELTDWYIKVVQGFSSHERLLRAWRSVDDADPLIDKLPAELQESARWMTKFRQAQAGVRNIQELDHADQLEVLDKVGWLLAHESPDFEGYAFDLLDNLRASFESALDDLVLTPKSPLLQKKAVRLIKDICKRDFLHDLDRISLLKKLGDIGPELHAAPTYDLRPGYNVQGYAYKLFKHELEKLHPEGKAELALHWAQQNSRWDTHCRPFNKKHWKNIGYAAGAVALAGGATGGIAAAAVIPAAAASAGLAAAIGTTVAKSVAISGSVGIVLGSASGIVGAGDKTTRAFGAAAGSIAGAGLAIGLSTTVATSAATAIAGSSVGGIGTGAATGLASAYAARRLAKLATKAVHSAGGIKAVGIKLRKNPICSIQTAVQRTAFNAFSYPNTHSWRSTRRAEAAIWLAPHYPAWIDTISTFPPALQAQARDELAKVFNLNAYRPEHREIVEQAIRPARDKFLAQALAT